MICANPILAAQDRALSERYFKLYGKLSDTDKKELQKEQRQWIKGRYLSCTPDFDKGVNEEDVREAIDCAQFMVEGRNQQLDGYLLAFDKLGRFASPEDMLLVAD